MTMVTTFKVVVSIITSIIISVPLLLVQLSMYHHYQQLLVQASSHRQCLLLLTPVVTMLLVVVRMQHLWWGSALAYLSSEVLCQLCIFITTTFATPTTGHMDQLLSSVISTSSVWYPLWPCCSNGQAFCIAQHALMSCEIIMLYQCLMVFSVSFLN